MTSILLVVLLGSPAFAQPPTAVVTHDLPGKDKWLGLSGSLTIRLSVEGSAPLRVELPEKLLAPETDRDWQIRPVGPATVTSTAPGREKWEQTFRLTPYVPGPHQVQFAPVKVNGRETPITGFTVNVRVESADVNKVDAKAAKPVTGIEELPPPLSDTGVSLAPWWWVGGTLATVAVALLVWRSRRKPPSVPPGEWALGSLDMLERDGVSGRVLVERVAAIVREFIDRRFGVPAPRLTTAELLAAADAVGWSTQQTQTLRELLRICDQAKFAGHLPDQTGCQQLVVAAREWVRTVDPEPNAMSRSTNRSEEQSP